MLDTDSADQHEASTTPALDVPSPGTQKPEPVAPEQVTDNESASSATTPLAGSKFGEPTRPSVTEKLGPSTSEMSDQSAALQAAPRPSIALLQMIAKPTVSAVNSKAPAQGRSSSSTRPTANRTDVPGSSDSVEKPEVVGAAPFALPVLQAFSAESSWSSNADNTSAGSSPSTLPPLAGAQTTPDTGTNDAITLSAKDAKAISGQATPNSATPSYDAFTIEVRSKSSASDAMNSASAVSIASSRNTALDSGSGSKQSVQNDSLPSNSSVASDSPVSPKPDIAQQVPSRVPSDDTASAVKPAQHSSESPAHNTAQSGITETPLAEKVGPQETGQMEASPVSASTPAVKSQTVALSAAASIPDKRKSSDEQGSTGSHSEASQITDVRGMASVDWKTTNQVRSSILEKNQSSAPVQPNDTQEQVAGGLVKQIVLKVEDPSGQSVSVRLTDRGSQVAIGVRSNDSAVSAALKQDLPSLVGNLDRAGWRVDSMPTVHAAGHEVVQTTVAQKSSDDPQSNGRSAPEWNYEQQGKKRPTAELWEEVLNRQSSY